MKLEIKIFINPEETAYHIAEEIVNLMIENDVSTRDTFIGLSGGNTPKILFRKLAENFKDIIHWEKLHLFWCDERCVPPGSNESNFGIAKKYLLDNIDIPGGNIHRIRGEEDPLKEVVRIAAEINDTVPGKNNLPQLDLSILGLGEDGHTASLFPGKKLKHISNGIAGIALHPVTGQKRISLTQEVINNTRRIIFMVTGGEKADIVYEIMSADDSGSGFPAAKVRAGEVLKWYLDKDAASRIKMP